MFHYMYLSYTYHFDMYSLIVIFWIRQRLSRCFNFFHVKLLSLKTAKCLVFPQNTNSSNYDWNWNLELIGTNYTFFKKIWLTFAYLSCFNFSLQSKRNWIQNFSRMVSICITAGCSKVKGPLFVDVILWLDIFFFFPKSSTCIRSNHQRRSLKKDVLRNFAKFTEKHLCQSLVSNKVAGLRPLGDCFWCMSQKDQYFSYLSFFPTTINFLLPCWKCLTWIFVLISFN